MRSMAKRIGKQKAGRNVNLRKQANGKDCIRCGASDAILAHYSGPWQHQFGKGRGIKGNDIAAAELCNDCHVHFDEYRGVTSTDVKERQYQAAQRSDEFLAMCLLTNIRRAA